MTTAPDESGTLLSVSVELGRVRGCLLEDIGGQYRLVAWLVLPRLPDRTMPEQIAGLCRQMGKKLGRRLWDDAANAPFLSSDDHTRHPPLAQVAIALSPLPCLRVWLSGLTPGRSLTATRSAVRGGPAQIIGTTTLASTNDPVVLARQMSAGEPDVLVLAGGYDTAGPSVHEALYTFAGQIAQALSMMAPRERPAVLFAGNQDAAVEVEKILRSAGELHVTAIPNVMPEYGKIRQDILAPALEGHYWRACQALPDFATLEQWVAGPGPITTLESNFARLVHVWLELKNLHDLHGVYCTPDHRIHVWATAGQPALRIMYTTTEELPAELQQWPRPALISGNWPARLGVQSAAFWGDRGAMAPLLAPIGSLAPHAMIHVLTHDILTENATIYTNRS